MSPYSRPTLLQGSRVTNQNSKVNMPPHAEISARPPYSSCLALSYQISTILLPSSVARYTVAHGVAGRDHMHVYTAMYFPQTPPSWESVLYSA